MADLDVVEREAREARREADGLRARVAALEAALWLTDREMKAGTNNARRIVVDALGGGTAALDGVVAAAVDAERARIAKAVEELVPTDAWYVYDNARGQREPWHPRADVLAAIGGAS